MALGELSAYAPGFDWPSFSAAAGVSKAQKIVVNQDTAVTKIARRVPRPPRLGEVWPRGCCRAGWAIETI
jgi:putative endopeptidase